MAKLKVVSKYGITPNSLLNSKTITLKAKGLFAFIQSKPDNWDFSVERISMQLLEGVDSIRKAVIELEESGYLVRHKYQNEKGFWEIEYILYETPSTDNPTLDNPRLDCPSLENTQNNSKKEISNKDNSNICLSNKEVEEIFNSLKNNFDEKYMNDSAKKTLNTLLKNNYTKEQIISATLWAKKDNFWGAQFLSLNKLNNVNKEKVKYIDVFLSKCGGNQIIVKSEPIKTYRDKINDELSKVSNNQQLKIKEADAPEY
jgi:hypothetical protein